MYLFTLQVLSQTEIKGCTNLGNWWLTSLSVTCVVNYGAMYLSDKGLIIIFFILLLAPL